MHRGCWFFLYARKTHTHDNVLNRQEMVLIGMLLIASVPATWMLVG
ncbi:arginine/ornithine antiporter [Escherichia coli]|uniref:Arginine/ornithine antiporter n=1 Tax=Escherichia coli TaxID=562 RepID=A0A377BBV1_ECOLX|nr:arginine/ornithine antiporter [Escherichia coli]